MFIHLINFKTKNMKKLFTLAGVLASVLCYGQANDQGVIHLGLGWGLTLGGATIEQSFPSPYPTESSRGIGGNSNYGLDFGYGLNEMLSVGAYVRKEGAAYIATNANDDFTMDVRGFGFGLKGKFYAVNKDKFTLYFGPDIGFSTGKTRNYDDSYEMAGKASGLAWGLHGGLGWYWAKFIGMYFDFGYNHSSMNGEYDDAAFKDYSYKIKNGGVYIGLGIAAKFGGD